MKLTRFNNKLALQLHITNLVAIKTTEKVYFSSHGFRIEIASGMYDEKWLRDNMGGFQSIIPPTNRILVLSSSRLYKMKL